MDIQKIPSRKEIDEWNRFSFNDICEESEALFAITLLKNISGENNLEIINTPVVMLQSWEGWSDAFKIESVRLLIREHHREGTKALICDDRYPDMQGVILQMGNYGERMDSRGWRYGRRMFKNEFLTAIKRRAQDAQKTLLLQDEYYQAIIKALGENPETALSDFSPSSMIPSPMIL